MAAVNYQGSSTSSFSRCKYQVFLSFRGKDTRKNFTDHLYRALVQAGIHTFRDDDEIQRGENIELELENAIKESKISIIVFSKDYASSRWCLDELVMIMEQRRTAGLVVLPVFYGVEPSHVRHQIGSFATSFLEHEKRFKEMERVNGWRIALKEIADLAGKELRDGYEAQFVESIVKEVSKKLDRRIFHVPLHFLGRDSKIDDINSWLQDASRGAAIAILYGVGGVGKTTIAKSVYNQNFHKFDGGSFLADVRERSKESNGLVYLQRRLLYDIQSKNANEIYDVDEGIIKIKDALCCRRTLIVLDDVEKKDQFNAIIGMQNFLCRGSKIIVTTRNKSLISIYDECVEFPIKPLVDKDSLELFSWHAFGQAHPTEDFSEHSKRMVHHCKGLPLALRVIGSSLCGKRMKVWESALQDIEEIPNSEVLNVLKVSYDSLDDSYQKHLFLDIACFFNGMKESYALKILDGLGIGAMFRIDNLIDRCLLEIDKEKRLCMHQLIRDMGREVARQESSKCQRIWNHLEAFAMLKETTDTERVRGLTLDLRGLMEGPIENSIPGQQHNFFQSRLHAFFSQEWLSNFFLGKQVQTGQKSSCPILGTDAFRKMQNVKFLQLNYVTLDGSYVQFSKSLIWLCWHGFPLSSIPKHFYLEKLVVLDLSRSSLIDVWKGKMYLPKLKILDLRHSLDLLRTPDLSGVPCLEELILEDCICLVQIHESIGDLRNLSILNLRNCSSLVDLPEEVSRMDSLEVLVLDRCSNLGCFRNMELLNMEQLQPHWTSQKDGIVAGISYITALPLKLFLQYFRFSTRNIISRRSCFTFPCSLVELNLSETPIRSLPESIRGLITLKELSLWSCQMLQTLPQLPTSLVGLNANYCYSLQTIASLPQYILVRGCEKLVQDIFKLELIQKASLHMFRTMETIIVQRQPQEFEIHLIGHGNIFHVLLPRQNVFPMFNEGGGEWVIQNEFKEYLSFKISTEHPVCGLYLSALFSATSESVLIYPFYFTIKNNTKGRSRMFSHSLVPLKLLGNVEFSWLSHWKCEEGELNDGDEVSVSVHTDDPHIQIKTVGVRLWCKEEGSGNEDMITSHSNEVIVAHNNNSSNWDNQTPTLGDEHVAKAQIASLFFSNYYCSQRYDFVEWGDYCVFFHGKS